MKKICAIFLALMLSSTMMAKEFVGISYSNRSELEKIFNDPNLTVHYYTNNMVFATATNFDARTMVLIDQQAFAGNEVYIIAVGDILQMRVRNIFIVRDSYHVVSCDILECYVKA